MFRVNKKGKSRLQWDKVQDTGTRTAFGTGSQRDTQEGKGRFDLIPAVMLRRLAQHYENGALKYGDNNWQKGQPLNQYWNSAMRHLLAIQDGLLDEDHYAAVIWNVACMIHHIDAMLDGKLPESLDSFGIIPAIKEQETMQQLKEFFYDDDKPRTILPGHLTWTPVVLSGQMDDRVNEAIKGNLTEKYKAWDKDRFSKLGDMDDSINEKHRK